MERNRKLSLLALDVACGGVCIALLSGFVYLTFLRGDRVAAEIDELSQSVQRCERDLGGLRISLDEQSELLRQRRAELAANGRLPEQTPIEEYFQNLSNVATRHRLRVVRRNPLSARSYPGLLEQRFAYEISGAMPDIVRFLKAIEDAKYWADVSYLRIAGGSRLGEPGANDRVAMLTISVFSSPGAGPIDRG